MPLSLARYSVSEEDDFQGRVLVLAIRHAQEIMNVRAETDDLDLFKLKAKAQELLNSPEQFRERLALSVVSLLPDELFEVFDLVEFLEDLEDGDIERALLDAFDALAGVTPLGLSG